MRLARSISSDGVSSRWRPISFRKSCSVSVVTVANWASSIGASGASCARAVVAQLDVAGVQLLVEGAEILVLELQGLGELVDLLEVDAAALLPSVDEGPDGPGCRRHAPVPWLPH